MPAGGYALFSTDVRELIRQKDELQAAITIIEDQIRVALPNHPVTPIDWKVRAINCIKGRGVYSTSVDILQCLTGKDYSKLDETTYDKYILSLSVALNSLAKEGYIKKVRIVGFEKANYYSMNDWVEADGTLKLDRTPEAFKPIIDNLNAKIKGNYVAQ